MEGQGWLCTVMSSKSPGILLSEAGRQPTECSSLDLITLDPLSIFLRTLNYTCISGVSTPGPNGISAPVVGMFGRLQASCGSGEQLQILCHFSS